MKTSWKWRTTFLSLGMLAALLALSGCASTPKSSAEKLSEAEASDFLKKYCSASHLKESFQKELIGSLLVRSNTQEFKGQYPASIHFDRDQVFTFEVTNLLGGTVAILKGNSRELEIVSPGHSQYNKKGIRSYMGVGVPLLLSLLHGELPCPESTSSFRLDGSTAIKNAIVIKDGDREWWFEKTPSDEGGVPVRVKLLEKSQVKVEMIIEKWNAASMYAEKVQVRTPEGDLKWTWRSRDLK